MRTVEDQLSSARADVQRIVAQMPTRSAETIRRRQQYTKATGVIASGALVVALIFGVSLVFPGETQNLAGTSPVDSPPATSGLTPEEEQAIEDALVGDEGDGTVTEDGPETDPIPEPATEDWIELPGGLSVAAVREDNGHVRIWTKSVVQVPTPAPSTDIAFLPVPVNATQIALLIPSAEFTAEAQGAEVVPGERPEVVEVHWFEGSDAIDTVDVDWSGDPRFGVALIEARDASILDVESVTD